MRDLVRFEWRYHTRQISFYVACSLFLLFGFAVAATGFGPGNVHINSPFSIMQSIGVLSLMSVFVLSVFCASAVTRDSEYRMEEILFSTGVEKPAFLTARFSGALIAAAMSLLFSVAGMLAGTWMTGHDASRLGALDPLSYLWAIVLLGIPNIVFVTVILFAVALMTRSLLASAVASVVIYVLYFVAAAWSNSPLMASSVAGIRDGFPYAALFDPFGISAFFEYTRHWTAAERNTRLLPLSGIVLANRLLWLAVAATGWALVYRFFGFRVSRRSDGAARVEPVQDRVGAVKGSYRPVAVDSTRTADLRALWSTLRLESRLTLRSPAFLILLAVWSALAFSEVSSAVLNGEYGSDLYPVSALVLQGMHQALALVGLILVVYYSGDIVWREKYARINGVTEATRASRAAVIIGKWATICLLVLAVVMTGQMAGVVFQLSRGFTAIDWSLMLQWGWFAFSPLAVFAMFAVLLQVVAPNRYVGLFLVLMLAVVRDGQLMGIEHPLLRIAAIPGIEYSGFYGFGASADHFHALLVQWALAGCIALLIASALQGVERGGRWSVLRGIFSGRRGVTVVALVVITGSVTAVLLWNMHVVNDYVNARGLSEWKADYERKYGAWEVVPSPAVKAVKAVVELYPHERSYTVRGEYELINESTTAMSRVLVSTRREARSARIDIDGGRLEKHDPRFGHHLFLLSKPLEPGDTSKLHFELSFAERGLSAGGPQSAIVENGSWIPEFRAFPRLGYRSSYEITDALERNAAGLPRRDAGSGEPPAEWVTLDLTVSTDAAQIPLTSGELQKEWVENGRRYRHYRTPAAIPHVFTIASGEYDVRRAESGGGVSVELYHHPEHAANVETILRAAVEGLHVMEQIAPYPHETLRIVEAPAPGNGFGGFARPDTIYIVEDRGFLTDARDASRLDLVSRRVAHEVAHQWWGINVAPVEGPGASMIAESLTKLAELLVLERLHGPGQVSESLDYELNAYLEGRTADVEPERPMIEAGDQAYLYYRKGAIVFWALRDLLGPEVFDTRLRAFFAESAGRGRAPSASRLVELLGEGASAEQQRLISDWMTRVVLYDIAVESAHLEHHASAPGIVLNVTAWRKAADGSALSIDEEIDVGLRVEGSDRLSLSRHRVTTGGNRIRIPVSGAVTEVIIDPRITRVDVNRFDNTMEL